MQLQESYGRQPIQTWLQRAKAPSTCASVWQRRHRDVLKRGVLLQGGSAS